MSSWSENLINILSCVAESPIVVSVPKWIKCLVVGDTKVNLDAVGLPTSSSSWPPKVLAAVKVPNAV